MEMIIQKAKTYVKNNKNSVKEYKVLNNIYCILKFIKKFDYNNMKHTVENGYNILTPNKFRDILTELAVQLENRNLSDRKIEKYLVFVIYFLIIEYSSELKFINKQNDTYFHIVGKIDCIRYLGYICDKKGNKLHRCFGVISPKKKNNYLERYIEIFNILNDSNNFYKRGFMFGDIEMFVFRASEPYEERRTVLARIKRTDEADRIVIEKKLEMLRKMGYAMEKYEMRIMDKRVILENYFY